jgi:hypothetical protein
LLDSQRISWVITAQSVLPIALQSASIALNLPKRNFTLFAKRGTAKRYKVEFEISGSALRPVCGCPMAKAWLCRQYFALMRGESEMLFDSAQSRSEIRRYSFSKRFMSFGVGVINNPHFRAFRNSTSLNPTTLPVTISSIPVTAAAIVLETSLSVAILATIRRASSNRSVSGSSITASVICCVLTMKL